MAEATTYPCILCGTTGGYVPPNSSVPRRTRRACDTCYQRLRRAGRMDELDRATFDGRGFLGRLLVGEVEPDEGGCILWPGPTTAKGYAEVQIDGSHASVTQRVLEEFTGPKPSSDHQTAHAPHDVCGNRHCVNIEHIRWATHQENQDDRVADGTTPLGEKNGNSHLVADEVREMRRLYASGGWTQRALADRYGVHQATVWNIVNGRTWGHIERESE